MKNVVFVACVRRLRSEKGLVLVALGGLAFRRRGCEIGMEASRR